MYQRSQQGLKSARETHSSIRGVPAKGGVKCVYSAVQQIFLFGRIPGGGGGGGYSDIFIHMKPQFLGYEDFVEYFGVITKLDYIQW